MELHGELHGKGVSGGVAMGTLVFAAVPAPIAPRPAGDVAGEIARFEEARRTAVTELEELAAQSEASLGAEGALLFEIHATMLEDGDLQDCVYGRIRQEQVCAEYAVWEAGQEFSQLFAAMEDDYLRQRAPDVLDITRRVTDILTGAPKARHLPDGPVILAGEDFTPSETAKLDRSKVVALATQKGSDNGHTAIFARTMGIPALIGLGETLTSGLDGRQAALDADAGVLYIDPDASLLEALAEKRERQREDAARLEALRDCRAVTQKGRSVKLFANIGAPEDAAAALGFGAEGVGLFRSEFLYLGRDSYPTEEEQYAAYRAALESMGGRQVVIRTLDIGADKQAGYFQLPHEENPALGLRAIRICLTRPEIFKTQLRAVYRAAVYGDAAIMLPMITSVEEVRQAKSLAAEARSELSMAGVPFREDVPIGIMIETPASAVISDRLAPEVDFFSVGTNDLIQYTLAADRQSEAVVPFRQPHHEAVLRLIRYAAESAHKNGIWIGICGELAADLSLTKAFLDMGIDELSMAPPSIPKCKERILALDETGQ